MVKNCVAKCDSHQFSAPIHCGCEIIFFIVEWNYHELLVKGDTNGFLYIPTTIMKREL